MTINRPNITLNPATDTREAVDFEIAEVPTAQLNVGASEADSLRNAAILTLFVALFCALLTGGIAIAYQFIAIWRFARNSTPIQANADWIIVPGVSLTGQNIPPDFQSRLSRVLKLPPTSNILVSGGLTGSATTAESVVGARWLIDHQINPDRIVAEISSRHTLENLRAAREILRQKKATSALVTTNRYHLRRVHDFSKTLGLDLMLCPAEEKWLPTPTVWTLILFEALWLHWHACGRLLLTLTGSGAIERTIK